MTKDTPSMFGLEAGVIGVVGMGIFSATGGVISGLRVRGIIRTITRPSLGIFQVFFNPSQVAVQIGSPGPLFYNVLCFCSGDLVTNTNAEYFQFIDISVQSVVLTILGSAGGAVRDPGLCHVTILGRQGLM